jgi:endonuclease/exonuclease/phosphatase family metal-dependent hydrolase
MGRNILTITVIVNERRMKVGTIHLESFLMAYSMRADQLDRCFAVLARENDDAVLLGDFNFGDEEPLETGRIPAAWRDAWKILQPGRPGYTWDIRKSHWAKRNSFDGEGSRRLDRILVRSDYWHPAEVRLLGDTPYVPGNREYFPSDHFGLVTTITSAVAHGEPRPGGS